MVTLLRKRPVAINAAPASSAPAFGVVACQRSGTHLLREILNSHPQLAAPSEPFSPSSNEICWENYLRGLEAGQRLPRHPGEALDLLDRYVAAIHSDVDKKPADYGGVKSSNRIVGLDVKYNQLSFVRPLYFDLRARPLLLDYFGRRRMPIVHLVRQNVLHVAISIIVADQRELWHVYNEASPPACCRIPPDKLLNIMRWSLAERNEFARLSAGMKVHACDYDEIVAAIAKANPDGTITRNAGVLQGLAAFLGVTGSFRFEGRIRKVLDRPYSETIENYQEVVQAVRKSEFSKLVRTI